MIDVHDGDRSGVAGFSLRAVRAIHQIRANTRGLKSATPRVPIKRSSHAFLADQLGPLVGKERISSKKTTSVRRP